MQLIKAIQNGLEYGLAGGQAPIATDAAPGLVKGNAAAPGRVSVEADGGMLVNGWGDKLGPDDLGPFAAFSAEEQFTGRYWLDGKKIYRKVVNCGLLPANGQKTVAHGISNANDYLRLSGKVNGSGIWMPLPYADAASQIVTLYVNGPNIVLKDFANYEVVGYTAHVTLEYTCTDR